MGTVALIGFSPDLEALIIEALRGAGFTARSFVLHGDIVPVLGKLKLDALLLDGHPFTNLGALVRAIREEPATAPLPILVVTATERDDLAGIDRVRQIKMPFDVDGLVAAIISASASTAPIER